ncbi:MAG: SGNH/GDSL hydrolase family protein [Bacteroidota bacterium]
MATTEKQKTHLQCIRCFTGIVIFFFSLGLFYNAVPAIANQPLKINAPEHTKSKADNTCREKTEKKWVGTWSTAPQLVEPRNMPPDPGLTYNTIRQVVRVSLGGKQIRVRFNNEFSTNPATLKKVELAASTGGSSIDPATITRLKFNGKEEVTMEAGTLIVSDPVDFDLKERMDVAITIYFGETPADVTGHPGSRTTSYLLGGDHTSAKKFTDAATADRWYVINGIDVKAPEEAAAVAILGNSITDGRGSGTNKQNRWPDILAERLLNNPETQQVAVLNQGIGGNCVLRFCLGPSAIDRFERDVLNQHGVKWLIILEGVNDLGQTPNKEAAMKVAEELIGAYKQMIEKAHKAGIKVYGATILPFKESFYYAGYREEAREMVNDWIRNSGRFDAVIDFDKTMEDPEKPSTLLPNVHTGDFLHPNEKGYEIMGKSIDLSLFEK